MALKHPGAPAILVPLRWGPHWVSDTAVLDPRTPWGVLASVRAVLCDSGRVVTGTLTWAQQERTVQSLREVRFDEVRFSPPLP